jgi:hypothetical protein
MRKPIGCPDTIHTESSFYRNFHATQVKQNSKQIAIAKGRAKNHTHSFPDVAITNETTKGRSFFANGNPRARPD